MGHGAKKYTRSESECNTFDKNFARLRTQFYW